MSKILIVEDDENILELEKDYIEASNMEAQGATNGNDGLELALNNDYDLILLDVMLPGINGFDNCKKIRETKNTPVIFVTAKREEIDKISGLGFGADDYIVKPFSPAELVARIKAHINRYKTLTSQNEQEKDVLVRDNIKLFKNTGEAFVGDKEITLTKKEFEVLYILASHPNTIYSKAELFGVMIPSVTPPLLQSISTACVTKLRRQTKTPTVSRLFGAEAISLNKIIFIR